MIAEFDHRNTVKLPVVVDHELPVLERVEVALNQEQVRTGLYRQEARAGNVDSTHILEVLYCRACSRLQLGWSRKIEIISRRRCVNRT